MKPHKWQKEIIAWANGETIQTRDRFGVWETITNPSWLSSHEYRIKPQEDSLQKEKEHWKNGGDVQYYNPYEKQWFDLINKPNWEPDWNGLFTIWRIKPEQFKWQKEKDHWEKGGKIQYKDRNTGEWTCYFWDGICPPCWEQYEWRIKPTETCDEETRKSIDEVLDCMDFEKIKKVMDFLNWTWWNTDGVPEIYELRIHARELLTRIAKEIMNSDKNNYAISCGGFRADVERDEDDSKLYFHLSFVLTDWANLD